MTTYYRYNGVDYADDDDLPLTRYTKHTRPALPTDILLRIIREADGGKFAHKENFAPTLQSIVEAGEIADSSIVVGGCGTAPCPFPAKAERMNHLIKLAQHPALENTSVTTDLKDAGWKYQGWYTRTGVCRRGEWEHKIIEREIMSPNGKRGVVTNLRVRPWGHYYSGMSTRDNPNYW